MPTALQERKECDSVSAVQKPRPSKLNRPADSETTGRLAELLRLLEITPVDLSRVTDELRRCGLEKVVVELGSMANASATGGVRSLEQAAVVLGTDRLRFLAEAWPRISSAADQEDPAFPGSAADLADNCTAGSPASQPLPHMEGALQLALLRWLQGGLFADPFASIAGWRGAEDARTYNPGDLFLSDFMGEPAPRGNCPQPRKESPAPRGAINP
jgi:hypothetical protein